MANTLANVYGALNILQSEGIGSLDTIPSNILKEGDVGIVVSTSEFHVYKLLESREVPDSVPPFTDSNPPLCIKPLDDKNADKRWILIYSSKYILNDIIIPPGKKIHIDKIETGDGFSIIDKDSDQPIIEYKNGKLHLLNPVADKIEVKNIKTDKINDIPENMYVLRNGSRSFTNVIEGMYPTKDEHLATKKYIDDEIIKLQPDNIMRRDGTTAFSAPVLGVMPIERLHLTPKFYVDDTIDKAIRDALNIFSESASELEKKLDTRNIIEDIKTTQSIEVMDRTLIIFNQLSRDVSAFLNGRNQGDMVYIKNFNTTSYTIELKSSNIGELIDNQPYVILDSKIKGCTLYYDGRDWFIINTMT